VQLPTDHLASLGAVELPRTAYLAWLEAVRDRHVPVVLDRLPVARLVPR
jgi:Leu/Phe-tRNA-protein transferase